MYHTPSFYSSSFSTSRHHHLLYPTIQISNILLLPNITFSPHTQAGIARARSRIILASLYLGSSKLEQDMVSHHPFLHLLNPSHPLFQIDAIHAAMSKNVNLEVTVLLDCMRGRRGGKVPTGEKPATSSDSSSSSSPASAPTVVSLPKSSLKLLQPLVQQFPDRVRVSLYHTPDLRGMWKKVIPNTYQSPISALLLFLSPPFITR